jgi:D-3-phosphoglycerate dehydrogenase
MPYRIGFPQEYRHDDGAPIWEGIGKDGLEGVPGLEVEFLSQPMSAVRPELLDRYDTIVATSHPFRAEVFKGLKRLVHIGRFGVGYDSVDLEAATRAGVAVTITRGQADRPVAEGALTMMLAVGHQLVMKDRLARENRWDERFRYNGVELRDRVIGIVGFGAIGKELARLLAPFGASRLLAYDPYASETEAASRGVELTPLETLMAESDFVSVNCLLSPETTGLIGERELALMKSTAFLVNTARGPIIDQPALTRVLQQGLIRGAALDVFRDEPVAADEALLRLENVIVAPHAIAVTEELWRDYHGSCVRAALTIKEGRLPEHIVNPDVVETPAFEEKLARLRERGEQRI